MRLYDLIETASAGASSAGSVAPVSMPLGTQTRAGGSLLSGKYSTDPTPNTPPEIKRFKKNARGQFKNSISN
jgi:hypothetical protein